MLVSEFSCSVNRWNDLSGLVDIEFSLELARRGSV